ncbi:hypothetical protein PFISCL1PPCAC_23566, partial [Pristionchus fissidentatus]
VHSHFLTTLVHFLTQLVHLGIAIFFTTQWHLITSDCPPIGHIVTSVFGALTAIYAALSTAKGYALLTHFCDEPWPKKTLSILSMVTSSFSAVLACGSLILLEVEVSNNSQFCGITTNKMPLHPSRIFLIISALLNIIIFSVSLFLHWRQSRVEACDRGISPLSPSALSSIHPSAPPLSNPSTVATRLDPTARLHSPDYFIMDKPSK